MAILVTGAAGFIGFHTARQLLEQGETVIGVDNLNDYYDPSLKRSRLALLTSKAGFTFYQIDTSHRDAMLSLCEEHREVHTIIHLAAQAGVRYSLEDPYTYVDSNVMAQVVVLEAARRLRGLRSLVYASSSSVYGNSPRQPFKTEDRADHPVSVYAATKRAAELITESYAALYGLPSIGLRLFTVYGPWGRPDMATHLFTRAILNDEPIKVFGDGSTERDFTYVDDVISAISAAAKRPPGPGRHLIYNIGGSRPVRLMDFIAVLERAIGKSAIKEFLPIQPGDVPSTYADIGPARRDLGYSPKTPIETGLPNFVAWYARYYGVALPSERYA